MHKTSILSCLALLAPTALSQAAPPTTEIGASAFPFPLNQVTLSSGRFHDNQDRSLTYLKAVDVNRLLYNFRKNHGLSVNGAAANGGWDAPDFPFRTHAQGHFLTAWSQCWSQLGDAECKTRALNFVEELKKCQANNAAAKFNTGYLSGFPESEFDALEKRTLSNGNVPYYAVHKTMAGVLDVWRYLGSTTARDVVLAMGSWVDGRTSKLSTAQMQALMQTEFGGMTEVLADMYAYTGDKKWLTVAGRFYHSAVLDPLANNQDQLNGLHANTQVPKWIGAARTYKASGDSKQLSIARNAWSITTKAHTYAIGGNSQAEHFKAPNAIAGYLTSDTAEHCNSYNMLKLTRELWTLDPSTSSTAYFDFYEQSLLNHILGAQNPKDSHGGITYFTPLIAGGHRGVGPAWGGGTWSTDYNSFWCCQGTGIEVNTKHTDSIYFHDSQNSTLWVNLFLPSKLNWSERGVTVEQSTTFPVSDTTSFKITGTAGTWAMNIRIPSWTSGATITVNGASADVTANPGSYARISRAWASGDVVEVKLPMKLRTIAANDNANVQAVAFGPTVLAGNYGSTAVSKNPSLALNTVARSGTTGLTFTATADSKSVTLSPFYDAQGYNYVVYWATTGKLSYA